MFVATEDGGWAAVTYSVQIVYCIVSSVMNKTTNTLRNVTQYLLQGSTF